MLPTYSSWVSSDATTLPDGLKTQLLRLKESGQKPRPVELQRITKEIRRIRSGMSAAWPWTDPPVSALVFPEENTCLKLATEMETWLQKVKKVNRNFIINLHKQLYIYYSLFGVLKSDLGMDLLFRNYDIIFL